MVAYALTGFLWTLVFALVTTVLVGWCTVVHHVDAVVVARSRRCRGWLGSDRNRARVYASMGLEYEDAYEYAARFIAQHGIEHGYLNPVHRRLG